MILLNDAHIPNWMPEWWFRRDSRGPILIGDTDPMAAVRRLSLEILCPCLGGISEKEGEEGNRRRRVTTMS